MFVRPMRGEIRFHKTGKMGPGNSGAGNLGSRQNVFDLIWAKIKTESGFFFSFFFIHLVGYIYS